MSDAARRTEVLAIPSKRRVLRLVISSLTSVMLLLVWAAFASAEETTLSEAARRIRLIRPDGDATGRVVITNEDLRRGDDPDDAPVSEMSLSKAGMTPAAATAMARAVGNSDNGRRGSRARSAPSTSALRLRGPWRARSIGAIRSPLERMLVQWVLEVFRREEGRRELWPGFTLDDQCFVLAFAGGSRSIYAIGRCGAEPGGRLLVNELTSKLRAESATPVLRHVDGTRVGLEIAEPILYVFPSSPRGESEVREYLFFVVHEAFHANYQTRRHREIPGEMRVPGYPAGAATVIAGTDREYLEGPYPSSPAVRRLLHRETSALVTALGKAAGRESPTALRDAALWIDEALRARAERLEHPGAIPFSEDAWEIEEGIPTNLERRAVSLLRERGWITEDSSVLGAALAGLDPSVIEQISFFLLSGALKAAILDELVGWEAWPALVFPGRTGEGLSLTQALEKVRRQL